MASTVEVRDIGDLLQNLTGRVRSLEQRSTVAAFAVLPSDPSFNTITVGGDLVSVVSDPATALAKTPGIFLDNIYVDISWTASATANEYQVELAEKIAGVYQGATQYRTAGTGIRIEHLKPNTTYGARVYAINSLGLSSLSEPPGSFSDFTTGHDATIPSALTGFTATAGFRSMVVVWNDTTDFDFDYYDLQLATNAGFTTGLRNTVVRGSIGGFTDLTAATAYWVRARAVDQSGNIGPWTAGASVTTQQLVGGDVPLLYIDSAVIANLAVLTAKIDNLAVTNAKFNDAIIDKISAGTITSKDYVLGAGGQLKTSSLAPGFVINSQGVSFYNSSGTRTIFLDAATGSGTFYGTIAAGTAITAPVLTGGTIQGSVISGSVIKTSLTGNRVEVTDSAGVGYVWVYTGDTDESLIGNMVSGVSGSGATRTLFTRVESGAYSTAPNRSRTHWYSDRHNSAGTAYIEHFANLHLFSQGPVQAAFDVLVVGSGQGVYIGDTTSDAATFKGTWGGSGGALRGRNGYAISFDWTGVTGHLDVYIGNTFVYRIF